MSSLSFANLINPVHQTPSTLSTQNPFSFDPTQPCMPAQHQNLKIPAALRAGFNLYVNQRDRIDLKKEPSQVIIDSYQKERMQHLGLRTFPGWGNFTFGANALNFAQQTLGKKVRHISVSPNGPVQKRGQFTILGEATMSVTPEWIHELKTIIARIWLDNRMIHHQGGNQKTPTRTINMGHSKGGALAYLLACVRESSRQGCLTNFIEDLKDEAGKSILKELPLFVITEVAESLDQDLIGSIGSPLYGLQPEFLNFANAHWGPLGFNHQTGHSARYFSPAYMQKLHQMTGYQPASVLDFVVTSEITTTNHKQWQQRLKAGAAIMSHLIRGPIINTPHFMLKGLAHYMAQDIKQDGIAPIDYPEEFKLRIHFPERTHLQQVESPEVMHTIFQRLIESGQLDT